MCEKHLRPIYERLSDPALLARCLPGYTQNANKSVNSLVWVRCPKHKWHERKRIELATASAVYFSGGPTVKHEVRPRAGLAVGAHTRKASNRRNSRRTKEQRKEFKSSLRNIELHEDRLDKGTCINVGNRMVKLMELVHLMNSMLGQSQQGRKKHKK